MLYFTPMSVGTPPEDFSVSVSTSTQYTWVTSTQCNTTENIDQFSEEDSASIIHTNDEVSI